jgi:hypothetical protein
MSVSDSVKSGIVISDCKIDSTQSIRYLVDLIIVKSSEEDVIIIDIDIIELSVVEFKYFILQTFNT